MAFAWPNWWSVVLLQTDLANFSGDHFQEIMVFWNFNIKIHLSNKSCSLVVIKSALHAKGPRFEPGQDQVCFLIDGGEELKIVIVSKEFHLVISRFTVNWFAHIL